MIARSLFAAIAILLLAACSTTDEQLQAAASKWIGTPVRVYAEAHSLAPISAHDRPDGYRAFIFRRQNVYGSCGVTMIAVRYLNEWLISEIQTTCGAQAF